MTATTSGIIEQSTCCKACDKTLILKKKGIKLFCSNSCRMNYVRGSCTRLDLHKNCHICNVEFITRHSRAKYCSDKCYDISASRRDAEIVSKSNCDKCGIEILHKKANSRNGSYEENICRVCQIKKSIQTNIEHRSDRKRKMSYVNRRFIEDLREEMVTAYGGKCVHCNEKDSIVLTIDHINNDGAKERKINKGRNFYKILKDLDWPKDGLQLLCCNCNFRKEYLRKKNVDGYVTRFPIRIGVNDGR